MKKKNDEYKEKEKSNVTENIYHDGFFFGYDALTCKNKTINKEIKQMFAADSRAKLNMLNSLKYIKNLGGVKTGVKTGRKLMMTGSLWSNWKVY